MFLFIPGWDYQFIIFVEYLTKFMILENIEFKIYVVEQSWSTKFNRARLISIGYEEAMKDFDWDCLIFHDVDRIPQKSKIDYNCYKTGQVFHYMKHLGGLAAISQMTPETLRGIIEKPGCPPK